MRQAARPWRTAFRRRSLARIPCNLCTPALPGYTSCRGTHVSCRVTAVGRVYPATYASDLRVYDPDRVLIHSGLLNATGAADVAIIVERWCR
ncbi:hypothetical protein PR003_g25118 [Phytophthora rubi]|uniref:Uncharacterized protein n=1 Tax=Phytophthora rubi TaxID=129364 RepID=A0A6A4CRN2_9STRA|nr:hypothetical protein PR001_g23683 [Phytophthora rubi]KAE9291143.1 hypothetical protein PR003_g25118 [Phytophthora rubi]